MTFIGPIILALLIGIFIVNIFQRYKQLQLAKTIGLDGPKPDIVFGNLLEYGKIVYKKGLSYTPTVMVNLHKKYGETLSFYLGVHDLRISTTNKEFIKEVFIKQFSKFTDREYATPLTDCFPMYESLLQIGRSGPHGYGWKDIRSIVSPAFTTGKMKLMHPILHERSMTFVDHLKKKSKENPIIDLYEEFQALTMDVIGRTAFGVDADSINNREDVFYTQCRSFFNEFTLRKSYVMLIGFLFRSLGYLLRPFSKAYRVQQEISKNLRQVVKYRKEHINDYKRIDMIQILLQEDEERQKRENKPPMHIDTIVSNCFGFMLAGYETTSTALAYASWLLAKHQDVQEKLYNEIQSTLKDAPADYDNAMKMPYLDAVFKETLRLKPPVVFFTGRTCVEETTINGITIPKGVVINVPVQTIHWDEDNWENPLEFDPERFTDGKTYDQLNWIPFGVGPRHCAGIRFAEMEFKLTFVEVIRRFKIEICPESQNPLSSTISAVLYRPVDKVVLKVTSR